jgi:hypothetical protein
MARPLRIESWPPLRPHCPTNPKELFCHKEPPSPHFLRRGRNPLTDGPLLAGELTVSEESRPVLGSVQNP